MRHFWAGQDVVVVGVGTGVILKVRNDDNNRAIYDVELDDSTLTPTGWYIARAEELRPQ